MDHHHGVELDQPGKDSFRHRAVGAEEVLLIGSQGWAIMRETDQEPPDLRAPGARLTPFDLILVEGFKTYDFPKIEVHRPSQGLKPLWPRTAGIVAVAADTPLRIACPVPELDVNNAGQIACWIIRCKGDCVGFSGESLECGAAEGHGRRSSNARSIDVHAAIRPVG